MAYPDTPYDHQKQLDDLLSNSESQIDGLTAQRQSLMGDYDAINQDTFSEGAGAYGSVVIPFLAGYFGGGGGSPGLTSGLAAAGKAGETYYNNLDADEKARKALNLGEQKRIETERQDQINFSQQLTGYGIQNAGQREQSYLTGDYPGTEPYRQEAAAAESLAQVRANAQAEGRMEVDKNRVDLGLVPRGSAQYTAEQANAAFSQAKIPLRVTEPVSESFVKTQISAARQGSEAQSVTRRQTSFDVRQSEKQVIGFDDLPGATQDQSQVNKFSERQRGYNVARNAAYQAKQSLEKNGVAFTGLPAAEQGMYAGTIFNAVRLFSGTGATLSAGEKPTLDAFTPATGELSKDYVLDVLRGRGEPEFLDSVARMLDQMETSDAFVLKKVRSDGREDLYTPDQIAEIRKWKAKAPREPSATGATTAEQKRARLVELEAKYPGR